VVPWDTFVHTAGRALLACALAGCRIGYERTGSDAGLSADASHRRDGSVDASALDASALDASRFDGSALDASPRDDVGPIDAGPEPEMCTEIPRLAALPAIDGILEAGLSLTPIAPVAWMGTVPSIPPGNSAELAAAWLDDGLYLYVSVTDPEVYPPPDGDPLGCGDGIEVYVDADARYPSAPDNEFPGARRFVIAAPGGPMRAEMTHRAGGVHVADGAWTTSELGVFSAGGGYVMEMWITAADLGTSDWTLAAGRTLGFDLAVNLHSMVAVGCDDQNYEGTYYYRVADAGCEYPFCNPLAYCNARLIE
jgi:hypothetical protein